MSQLVNFLPEPQNGLVLTVEASLVHSVPLPVIYLDLAHTTEHKKEFVGVEHAHNVFWNDFVEAV